MTKEQLITALISVSYAVLILGLLVAAIWTSDARWAWTALILVLPSVILALVPNGEKKPNE